MTLLEFLTLFLTKEHCNFDFRIRDDYSLSDWLEDMEDFISATKEITDDNAIQKIFIDYFSDFDESKEDFNILLSFYVDNRKYKVPEKLETMGLLSNESEIMEWFVSMIYNDIIIDGV